MRQTLLPLRLNQPGAVVREQLRFGVVAAHAQVVPADAAAVIVGEQHLLPKRGIAAALRRWPRDLRTRFRMKCHSEGVARGICFFPDPKADFSLRSK